MKLLLLVFTSLAAGTPVLQKRSLPPSVYDYYDFVEIPKKQPIASSRSDGPLQEPVARASGAFPRRVALPLPPLRRNPPKKQAPFSGQRPKPQPRPFREPDYQLADPGVFPSQYRSRPKPKSRPQFQQRPKRPILKPQPKPQPRPQPGFYDYQDLPSVYQEEPVYPADESVFLEESEYQRELPAYEDDHVVERPPNYHEERRPQFQEERRPQFQEERRPQFQEERRPQFQEERRPQFQEERRPQFQEEKRPQEERRPQYKEETQPQYSDYQDERIPVGFQEERAPQFQEERPPYYEEEPQPYYEDILEKDQERTPLNSYRTTPDKESESVKEKRDAIHSSAGGGHFDENGLKFAANAEAVENAKGAGRLAFQIHGQQGPHSYRFGYDTGKGHNRQFRYEERDQEGIVHGRYGFYGEDGKLQVVNYSAHPKHGFSADVPKP